MRCTQVVNVIGLSVVLCYFCVDGVRAFVHGPQSPRRILRRPDAAAEVIPLVAMGMSQPSLAFDSGSVIGDDFWMAKTATVLAVLLTMQLVLARPVRAFFSIKTKKPKVDTSRRDMVLAVCVAGVGFVGLQELTKTLDFEEEVIPLTPADKKQKEVDTVTEKRSQLQKDSFDKNAMKIKSAQTKREEKNSLQLSKWEDKVRAKEEKKKAADKEEEEERLKKQSEGEGDPLSDILQFGVLVGAGATLLMKEKGGGKAVVDEDSGDSEDKIGTPAKAPEAVSPPRMPVVTEVPQRATRPAKQLRKI